MFARNIIGQLELWREKYPRKPLIISGARQVGKTTAVQEFGKQFSQFMYFNLELPEDRKPFENFSDLGTLLQALFFLKNKGFTEQDNTLIFIDEIQAVPKALQYLRYFYEQAPDIPVIAAGSLLETLFDPDISYPVGRVEYLVIRPASFTEFLGAAGETAALQQVNTIPVAGFAHNTLLKLFHMYCLIGGMPEIVANYAANKDLVALAPIYESLLVSYLDDVEKYAKRGSQAEHIRHAMRASFAEATKRIKFQHFGHSAYKSREMGEALRILEKALLIQLVFPQTSAVLPMQPDSSKSPRLQVLDTGMLNYFVGLQQEILGTTDLNNIYHGAVIEHVAGQELLARQYSALHGLAFWARDKATSNAEVDYLIRFKEKLVPVEVKAGAEGTLRSIHIFMDMAPHDMAVRLYAGKISISKLQTQSGKKFRLLNMPYYLVSQIDKYLEWFEVQPV